VTSLATRVALAVLAATSLAGCSRPDARSAASASATPPPLPADVRAVAAVAAPAPGTSPGAAPAENGGAVRQPEQASRLALTGEFVSLVRSDLVPRTGGRVGQVFVDEGQPVRMGQPLLQLETEYLRLDVARAEADLRRAEAAALDASRDLERKKGLAQKGSVSQATFDRTQSGADQADAGRQAARTALDLARQRLADATLTSPVDGVVAERRTDVGERLTEGTVAFVVEQTAPLKLRFRVPERYLASVRKGLAVRATVDAFAGQAFDGTVSLVGGSVDPQTRTFLVEAAFANRDHRLRPGQFARVETELGGK
jgi:membrane fusion protein (multidrug efflux system)